MTCVYGAKECDGCMACQEPKMVLRSDSGEPIYEGETYYEVEGYILTPDEIESCRKVAGE